MAPVVHPSMPDSKPFVKVAMPKYVHSMSLLPSKVPLAPQTSVMVDAALVVP
jgi:hypothetical protein